MATTRRYICCEIDFMENYVAKKRIIVLCHVWSHISMSMQSGNRSILLTVETLDLKNNLEILSLKVCFKIKFSFKHCSALRVDAVTCDRLWLCLCVLQTLRTTSRLHPARTDLILRHEPYRPYNEPFRQRHGQRRHDATELHQYVHGHSGAVFSDDRHHSVYTARVCCCLSTVWCCFLVH